MDMGVKVCNKCLIERPEDNFYREKRNVDGLMGSCKDCYNLKQKKWRDKNDDKVKNRSQLYREENKEKIKIYQEKNSDKIKSNLLKWKKNNPERNKELILNWKKNNPNKVKEIRKRQGKRSKLDIIFNLKNRLRCRLHHFLNKKVITKTSKTFDIIGCSPIELKEHLERRFTDNMSWENRSLWHIDHIIPLSSVKTEEEVYKLCHYTNLQPLWAEDNLKKSNKILKKI